MGRDVNRELETAAGKPKRIPYLIKDEHSQTPRLLVSVRSRFEAEQAVAGGADVLDVKEPSRGSLGMASIDAIMDISNLEPVVSNVIPFSVALGEVADWRNATVPSLPSRIAFAKLGLSQCAYDCDWKANWKRVREKFEIHSSSELNWVAVAYADSDQAASPSVSEVLQAAIETNCAGLLIDTWNKNGGALLDHLRVVELTRIAVECRAAGLFLALAGRVNQTQLTLLSRAEVSFDVIAIRSAACRGSDRTSEVEMQSVVAFKQCLRQSLHPAGIT